ncbi:hypothetical protein Pat9b_4177 (plasmid) [Pantoea sp. At-9b]|nr:hypothetical protein Pat9b_4177 [Pantoea sp. At-9b]
MVKHHHHLVIRLSAQSQFSLLTYSHYSQGRSNNLILIRSYIDPIKAKTIPGSLQALVSLVKVKI